MWSGMCFERSAEKRTVRGAVCQWHTSSADRAEGETLERSEGKKPRFAQQICILSETEGSRGEQRAQRERDKEARSRREQRGWSAAKAKARANEGWHFVKKCHPSGYL